MFLDSMQKAIFNSRIAEQVEVNGKSIKCIFFNSYTAIEPSSGNAISVNEPRICLKSSDVDKADIKPLNPVKLRGEIYYISDVQKDGEGIVELMLKSK